MNIYDHKQKWRRRENESLNGATYYSGGLFSGATCHPIVRLSHASPHQTRSQLKCSSPACQGAKTKYINSGKQISSVTLIWLQKAPSYGDAALAGWSVTPGDSKQTFRTSKKKKKNVLSQQLTRFCMAHLLLIFMCLYCFQTGCFPFFTSWFHQLFHQAAR